MPLGVEPTHMLRSKEVELTKTNNVGFEGVFIEFDTASTLFVVCFSGQALSGLRQLPGLWTF